MELLFNYLCLGDLGILGTTPRQDQAVWDPRLSSGYSGKQGRKHELPVSLVWGETKTNSRGHESLEIAVILMTGVSAFPQVCRNCDF